MDESDEEHEEQEEGRLGIRGEESTLKTYEGLLEMAKVAVRYDCALFFNSYGYSC